MASDPRQSRPTPNSIASCVAEREAASIQVRVRRHAKHLRLLAVIAMCSPAWGAELFFPDPSNTPGAISPAITQDNIQDTVCISGWTAKMQPPAAVTDRLKAQQMKALHLTGTPKDYHEDHLVPLCAGGHPTDPRNLWPQRVNGDWNYTVKDQLEGWVCAALCRGEMTLKEGQAVFLEPDWRKAYLKFVQVE